MKLKDLLIRLAEVAHIYGNEEMLVRVAMRNAQDVVTSVREVPISYLLLVDIHPTIAIEEKELNAAERVLP